MKTQKTFYVYSISPDGIRRYIGFTNNIKRRQTEHNRDRWSLKKKFYFWVNERFPNEALQLDIIATFETSIEAQRYEAYLILQDHFNNKNLLNSPPKRIKYW